MHEHTITAIRTLLEADSRLRQLEKKWIETGTLEDELVYHRSHLAATGYVELTKLSTKFTRWIEARKWFKSIWDGGSWLQEFCVNGTPMQRIMSNIERALLDRVHTDGQLFMASVAWRAYQVPGFLVYFTQASREEPGVTPITREMCASLWSRGGTNIDVQAVNTACPFENSYGLFGSQSSTHLDGILLSTAPKYRHAWYRHVRAGKR